VVDHMDLPMSMYLPVSMYLKEEAVVHLEVIEAHHPHLAVEGFLGLVDHNDLHQEVVPVEVLVAVHQEEEEVVDFKEAHLEGGQEEAHIEEGHQVEALQEQPVGHQEVEVLGLEEEVVEVLDLQEGEVEALD